MPACRPQEAVRRCELRYTGDMATATDPSDKTGSNGSSLSGLRFNQTGREDSAREVLKPQVDPSVRRRNAVIIVMVIVGITVVVGLSFARSGLSFKDVFSDRQQPAFGSQQTTSPDAN